IALRRRAWWCESIPGSQLQCGMGSEECGTDRRRRKTDFFLHSALHIPNSSLNTPRCISRSAPVSDTGGPGAIPGEATIAKIRMPNPEIRTETTENKHHGVKSETSYVKDSRRIH